MSYILDALKKSDQERKRGDVPGLQTVHIPMAAEQEKPWLLYAVVLFLMLALAFVVGLMLSGKAVEQGEPVSDSTEFALDQGMGIEESQGGNEVVLTEVVKTIGTDAYNDQLQEPVKSSVKEVAMGSKIAKEVRQTASIAPEKDLTEIPYLHELEDYQQQAVPDMQFAGHVYSSTASNRSVIINNNAMSEGDTIMQGLTVEHITSNGVVFRYQDLLFRMDILQDWSFE